MSRQGQIGHFFLRKSREGNIDRNRAGFLEAVEVDCVDFQAARGSHFQATSALVALLGVQVELTGVVPVFDDGFEGAGSNNRFTRGLVRAFFGEEVGIVVHRIVHRAARPPGHAAERDILERAAKTAARMALDVRKIDHEGRILNHPGHIPGLDVLVRPFVGVEILFVRPGSGINRAAEHLRSIATLFGKGRIPVDIDHKRFAAAILDGLDHAAHKNRMDGGIAQVIPGVHLQRHSLILNSITQVEFVDD